MGSSPSKKIEETLEASHTFQAAVDASYEECMILSQHIFPGLQAYQLLDAAERIYEKLTADEEEKEEDAVLLYKERWLPQPPTQVSDQTYILISEILDIPYEDDTSLSLYSNSMSRFVRYHLKTIM